MREFFTTIVSSVGHLVEFCRRSGVSRTRSTKKHELEWAPSCFFDECALGGSSERKNSRLNGHPRVFSTIVSSVSHLVEFFRPTGVSLTTPHNLIIFLIYLVDFFLQFV